MLAGAAQNRQAVAEILPQIYRGLLDESQIVRARAADAYGVIAKFGVDDLPALIHECFLNLAADSYVIVHLAFANVLKEIDLPEAYRPRIVRYLSVLIQGYVQGGQEASHTRRLIEAFCSQHDAQLSPDVAAALLSIAEGMPPDDAGKTALALRWKLRTDAAWIALAAKLAANDRLSYHWRSDLLDEVTGCDPAVIATHAEVLRHGVLLHVQEMPFPRLHDDEDFVDVTVEKLMCAGEWVEASRLLSEVEALYATSTVTRGRQRYTSRQKAAVDVESAVGAEARIQCAREWLDSEDEVKLDLDDMVRTRLATMIAFGEGIAVGHGKLTEISAALTASNSDIADPVIRQEYASLARIVDAFAFMIRWRDETREAKVDGDRYRRAALEAANDVAKISSCFNDSGLTEKICSVHEMDDIQSLFGEALRVPLPVPFRKQERYALTPPGPWRDERNSSNSPDVTIAFVRFEFEGKLVSDSQVIAPNRMHDLTVEVTVSDWPAAANTLIVDVLSLEPRSTYEFPTFTFSRPDGAAPLRLKATGRAVLHVAQSLLAAPFQFTYRAYFDPEVANVRVSIEGQRQLQVYGYDPLSEPQTGHRGIDRKLLDIKTKVRRMNVSDAETEDFMRMMVSLGSLAWRTLNANLFAGGDWPEKRFQAAVADKLREDPRIGSQLEEHPHVAAGITDLSFRNIRTELKVEGRPPVSTAAAAASSNQASQYVAGSDRRTGLICILDCSVKSSAPGAPENDVDLLVVEPTGGVGVPLALGVVILRGNLKAPSAFR